MKIVYPLQVLLYILTIYSINQNQSFCEQLSNKLTFVQSSKSKHSTFQTWIRGEQWGVICSHGNVAQRTVITCNQDSS
jgi:hypothetical protein